MLFLINATLLDAQRLDIFKPRFLAPFSGDWCLRRVRPRPTSEHAALGGSGCAKTRQYTNKYTEVWLRHEGLDIVSKTKKKDGFSGLFSGSGNLCGASCKFPAYNWASLLTILFWSFLFTTGAFVLTMGVFYLQLKLETGIGGVKSPKIRGGGKILNFRGSLNLTLFYRDSMEKILNLGVRSPSFARTTFGASSPPNPKDPAVLKILRRSKFTRGSKFTIA